MPARILVLALLALSVLPAGASAQAQGDPIMPLSQVRSGMQCTALSVVRGTQISSFDIEILDVIAGDPADRAPRILVRASGPAIDATGLGPGFSGSPIYCPDDEGTRRNAGAISEGIGEYGNKVALAAPIEQIIGETPDPPAGTRSAPGLRRSARPLAMPLSFGGVTGPVARALQRAGARLKRPVYAAPAAPRSFSFPPQQLVPGASVGVGVASGDITAGGVGTVAYADGDRVWAFAHALDGVGRRSLFLQDAYVYTVVNNPIGVEETQTYKLAASGHDLGTLTNDGPSAVAGKVGRLPASFPLRIIARDLDTGRQEVSSVQLADENAIGLPTGVSSLAQIGPVALAQSAYTILRGSPSRQSGEMCVRAELHERKRPLRFCNRYVGGGGPGSPGGAQVADFTQAIGVIDSFKLALLHFKKVEVNLKLRRGLRQAFLLRARGPRVVRRGSRVRLRVRMRRVLGSSFNRRITVRVPRGMPSGAYDLTLSGAPSDAAGEGGEGLDLESVFTLALGEEDGDETGPRSLEALAKEFASVHRYDGVTASFREPGAQGGGDEEEGLPPGPEGIALRERRVFRDDQLRISGSTKARVFVE